MYKILRKLCGLHGVSGNEQNVRDYIIKKISPYCDYVISPLGNIIAHKSGRETGENILFAAHMDEVGFIVTYKGENGFIKIAPVGGVVPSAAFGRQIKFSNGKIAVTGGVPVHHLTAEERDKQPGFDDIWADAGLNSDSAELGDTAVFADEYEEFGSGCIKAKAIDDRLGCTLIIDMLKKSRKEFFCAFTVQEEVGTRGAATVIQNVQDYFNVKIDGAVVLEATTACDIPNVKGADRVCCLGGGAVVPFMDGSAVYDRELYNRALDFAKAEKIKTQTKTKIVGGTDAGIIHKSLQGIPTLAISAPCRYLHTGVCLINKNDVSEMKKLLGMFG